MQPLLRPFAGLLSLVVLCSLTAAAEPNADLRTKLKPGQEVRYAWSSVSDEKTTKLEENARPTGSHGSVDLDLLIRIKDQSEEVSTYELVIEAIKMSMQAGPTTAEFDSKAPVAADVQNKLAPAVRPIAGTVLTLRVAKDGTISEVTGGEALLDPKAPTRRVAGMFVDPSAAKGKFWPLFTTRNPSESAAVGSTWTSTQTSNLVPGIAVEVTRHHTLSAADATTATIDLIGDAKLIGEAPPDLGTREIKGSSMTGTTVWDTTTGNLLEQTSMQGITLELKGPKVQITMDSLHEVRVKRKD